ncbi:MAG: hypothetical protein AAFW89_09610 [Bacteroidota bacterium]
MDDALKREIMAALLADKPKAITDRSHEIGATSGINFIFKSGAQQMLPYGHVITARLLYHDNGTEMDILFSSHVVTVLGSGLEPIYEAFLNQTLKTVIELKKQHIAALPKGSPFVTEIMINERDKHTRKSPYNANK